MQTNQIRPVRYLTFGVHVPSNARRFVDVEAIGGAEFGGFFVRGGGSFNRLLHRIKHSPRNASLVLRLFFAAGHRTERRTRAVRTNRSTTGAKFGRLRVVTSSKA